jgi:hypothetical protein
MGTTTVRTALTLVMATVIFGIDNKLVKMIMLFDNSCDNDEPTMSISPKNHDLTLRKVKILLY